MKRILYLLVAFIVFSFTLHKYYVSVIEVDLNEDSKQLEVSVKVFNDDWQNALDYKLGKPVLLGSENEYPKIDSLMESYLIESLQVSLEGELKNIQYMGSEIDGESTWLYLYIDSVSKVNEIEIKCDILTEMFEEQRNIVQIRIGEDLKSSLFTKTKNKKKFIFN